MTSEDKKEPENESIDRLFEQTGPLEKKPENAAGLSEEGPDLVELRCVCPNCDKAYLVGEKIKFCSSCGSPMQAVSKVAVVGTAPPVRVLLVEDATIARRKINGILKNLGCEVEEARDGMEAMLKVNQVQPDLVILDIHMPKKNGLQVLKELRSSDRFAATPVVMLTAEADSSVVAQAISLKASDYIRKDDSVDQIRSRLMKHLPQIRSK